MREGGEYRDGSALADDGEAGAWHRAVSQVVKGYLADNQFATDVERILHHAIADVVRCACEKGVWWHFANFRELSRRRRDVSIEIRTRRSCGG